MNEKNKETKPLVKNAEEYLSAEDRAVRLRGKRSSVLQEKESFDEAERIRADRAVNSGEVILDYTNPAHSESDLDIDSLVESLIPEKEQARSITVERGKTGAAADTSAKTHEFSVLDDEIADLFRIRPHRTARLVEEEAAPGEEKAETDEAADTMAAAPTVKTDTVMETAAADPDTAQPTDIADDGVVTPDIALFDAAKQEYDHSFDHVPADAAEASAADAIPASEVPAEEDAPTKPILGDGAEIDRSDIELMLGLGMDDQIRGRVGVDVDRIGDDLEKTTMMETEGKFEYTSPEQTKDIARACRLAVNFAGLKLMMSAVFAVLLLIFENIAVFGFQFGGYLNPVNYPVIHSMIDLQLLLLCAAFAYAPIFTGLKKLFQGAPSPETITAFGVIFAIAQTAVEVVTVKLDTAPRLYNSVVAICIVLTLLFTYLNAKRERYNFLVIAAKGKKYALNVLSEAEADFEMDAFHHTLDADYEHEVLRVERTDFVDGFVARTNQPSAAKTVVTMFLALSAAVAAAVFLLSYLGNHEMGTGVSLAFAAALFCMPLSVFFTYSYPLFRANRVAYDGESTIVGDASVDEYASASIVSLEDKSVFPSINVKIQNVNVYGNNRIDRVLYYASSVFARAGGPLEDVFDLVTVELGKSDDVALVAARDGYLEANVEERRICFGGLTSLQESGAMIRQEILDEDMTSDGRICVMYMAIDDEIAARINILYDADPEYELIIRKLYRSGLCVGIKTFDPNINDELLYRCMRVKKYPVKILHCRTEKDANAHHARMKSGIVSHASAKSLLSTYTLCDKLLHVRKTCTAIKVLSMIVGAALMGLLMFTGQADRLYALYIAAYQLIWLLPMAGISRLYLR